MENRTAEIAAVASATALRKTSAVGPKEGAKAAAAIVSADDDLDDDDVFGVGVEDDDDF